MAALLHTLGLFFLSGYRERLFDPIHLIAKFMSFLMLVWVWNVIWKMVPESVIDATPYDIANLTFYVAITEALIFCCAYLFHDMDADIKSGNIGPSLIRPVSYHLRSLSQWYGRALGVFTVFYPFAMIGAFIITGVWVPTISTIILSIFMMMCALFCFVCFNYIVGTLGFWIGDARPAYWIGQKLAFLFGGLLFPLTLYSDVLYTITQFLPFSAMFFLPGSSMLNVLPYDIAVMIAIQLGWCSVFFVLSLCMHQMALRFVTERG